jgi:hypothetical protein
MLTPRPKDKLMSLVNAGLMRRELMTAWAVVRNSTVHAADFKPTKTAKIFHNYQSALTLLNELIFLIIGYVGQYTDYSVVGWPERNWEWTKREVEGLRGVPV